MQSIALFQPNSLEEWAKVYTGSVKSDADLDEIANRGWVAFQDYRAAAQDLTEADFQQYVRELAIDRTFDGWSKRRDAVKNDLVARTCIPFDYLRDHAMDWRPKTYDIDFAAMHPDSKGWLAVKALPASTTQAGYPKVAARIVDMYQKHQDFEAKFGRVVNITFDGGASSFSLSDDDIESVLAAWGEVAKMT